MAARVVPVEVVVEVTPARAFASAIDWPGWSRSGRTPDAALVALAAYAPRYRAVAAAAGLAAPVSPGPADFRVIEEVAGDATTTFGAPSRAAAVESGPISAAGARRVASLTDAAWDVFDESLAAAPALLRKGPRGGGRDRDAIADHVLSAEHAYAAKIGIRMARPARDDAAAVRAVRDAILAVVSSDRDGRPPRPNGWSPRYAARRIAWHVLDHAWEMEDRSSA